MVFEEGAVGPLADGRSEHIAARVQLRGDVEFAGQTRALSPSQFGPVEPDTGKGIDSLEAQQHSLGVGEVLSNFEGVAVTPGGVLIGNDDVLV